jgi:autotransporter family porin
MNTAYKILWNVARQCWVVASELSTARGKSKGVRNAVAAPVLLTLGVGMFSAQVSATDYTAPITGPFTFVDGDTVTYTNPDITEPAAIQADGTEITASGALTINNASGAIGLSIINGGRFTSGGDVIINGNKSTGIFIDSDGSASFNNLTVKSPIWGAVSVNKTGSLTVTGKLEIDGASGTGNVGMFLNNGGTANVVDANIITNDVALYVGEGSTAGSFTSTGTTNLTATGAAPGGALYLSRNSTASFNDVNITSGGTGMWLNVANAASTGKMTIQSVGVGIRGEGGLNVNDLDVTTTGDNAFGVQLAPQTQIIHTGTVNINTSGTGSDGIYFQALNNVNSSQTIDFSNFKISTTGENADAVYFTGGSVQSGNSYTSTYIVDKPDVLSGLSVSGTDSALVHVRAVTWRYPTSAVLVDQTFNMSQVADGSWGGHVTSDNALSTLTLSGNSNTGGTGIWLDGDVGGSFILQDTASMAGSRVKFGGSYGNTVNNKIIIETADNSAAVGSLEGLGNVSFTTAGGTLTLGQNNATSDGSMVDNTNFSGTLTNVGSLIKIGETTQILSGTNNTVGSVEAQQGTLSFAPLGVFTTTGNYTTKSGATTNVASGSSLAVGGDFTQESGSTLVITGSTAGAVIAADTAHLDGNIEVNGLTSIGGAPAKSSEIEGSNFTLIHTTNGITGDFANNTAISDMDYLLAGGSSDGFDYSVGYNLAWTGGGQTQGTGTFTMAPNTVFEVDTVLADQSGTFDSGWNGKSLTKAGEGTLILSAANSYTGGTTVQTGTLQLSGSGSLGVTTGTTTVEGGTLDLGGTTQQQVALNQSSGMINNGVIMVDTYQLTGGELGALASVNASTLLDMQSGTVNGTLGGEGVLQKNTAGTVNINGVGHAGSVDVNEGTLSFGQTGAFTVTDGYTIAAGAATVIGSGSTLGVGGNYTQADNSTLSVTLTDPTQAAITAGSAVLDGAVVFNGFADYGGVVVSSSEIEQNAKTYTLITTTNGITGDLTVGSSALALPDYLLGSGHLSSDGMSYEISDLNLAWNDGGQAAGTGTFTMAEGTAFNVDTVLSDQSGTFESGWDGKSLTKAGGGLLILSAQNTYTGSTTVNGGTLQMGGENTIATSRDVIVNGGVVDLNGYNQQFNRLSGTGGDIQLNGAMMTLNNTIDADNTTYSGNIVDGNTAGKVTKTGEGTLTLTGTTGWTGTTQLEGGELVLDGSGGGAQLTSDIIGVSGAQLTLQNGASLTGTIDPVDVNVGAGSTWNMTGDSQVEDLLLAGSIKFVAPDAATGPGRTLTVQNLTGNGGTVELYTQLGDDQSKSDKIVIDGGRATGNTGLVIRHGDETGAQTVQGIQVVDAQNGATTDSGAFYLSSKSDGYRADKGVIAAGAYDYSLVKGGGGGDINDWYLMSDLGYRPETGVYLNNKYAVMMSQVHSLHDREEAGHDDGFWLRVGGESSKRTGVDGQSLSDSSTGVHMGGSVLTFSDGGNGKIIMGVMGQYYSNNNDSEVNGMTAEGSVSGYSLGLYGTWYGNSNGRSGPYVDTWVMSGKFDNQVKGEGLADESYSSNNTAGSLEAGYSFPVYARGNTTVFLEPQAQVIYSNYRADSYKEHTGTVVSDQSESATTTRLGLRVSSDVKNHFGDNLSLYGEVNWWHGPDTQSITFDGETLRDDLPGDRIESKAGLQGNLSKSVRMWATIGMEAGSGDYLDGKAQVGLKYIW